MRIRRLRLANFKDILSREVPFPPSGVIVIQGPNEIGKTALQEALDLVLELPADSRHRRVAAQRPAGRDVAPEVELEADCGPYSFTYFKRFDTRRPETWLRIQRPHPEQLTGREAHERVRSILEENLDLELWKALRVQQGAAIGQGGLADSRSLLAALDAAAGTVPAGEGELSLFERIEKEALRYFTPSGQPGQDLVKSRAEVEQLARQVRELTDKLDKLETTVERLQWLDRHLRGLDEELADAKRNREQRELELRQLEKLEADLAPLRANAEAAKAKVDKARERAAARVRLIGSVESIQKAVQELEQKHRKLAADLENAAAAHESRAQEASSAAKRREQAEELYELRRRDYEFRQDELWLAQLSERHGRVLESRDQVIRARELIERTKITRAGLKRIDDQRLALERARAALDTGSPSLRLEAEAELRFQLDGQTASLAPGQVVERTVADRVELRIPDLLKLAVRSGASVASLTQQVRTAETQLARLFKSYGVADRDEADRRIREREEAERTIHEAERRQKQDLRDLTIEEMDEKIAVLRERTATYMAMRAAQPEIGASIEQCEELRRSAESEATAARTEHERLAERAKAAGERFQELRLKVQEASAQLNLQAENRDKLVRELAEARSLTTDEVLEQELAAAAEAEQQNQELYVAGQRKLDELEPERIRSRAEIARGTFDNLAGQREDLSGQRLRLAAELEVRGQEGLGEALAEATAKLDRRKRELALLDRRAAAAARLLAVMRECREEARRRREGPLRDGIIELGRILHGRSFSIELDERLAVSRRTLNGTTLAFEQLSTGAQEQLSLIARLAAGMLVAGNGGVPIILDDTLGHTDEDRLEYMGAILTRAGRECQVIVLTSYPKRYAHVGGATVVTLVGADVERRATANGTARPEEGVGVPA